MNPVREGEPQRVAIVGTGLIGAGWTALFLARGLEVVAVDPAPDAESRLRDTVGAMWPSLVALGLAEGAPDLTRLRFFETPGPALEGVGLVQENAPERLDLKRAIFAEVEHWVGPDCILASSTSTLLTSDIQTACAHPERCIAAHPFNPPHIVPLVEISGGALTASEVLDRAVAFYRSLGKRPVRLDKEIAGHIAGRLSAALWREAVYLLEQGVASVPEIDDAVRFGPGPRWAAAGPHMTYHFGGGPGGIGHYLDHLGDSQQKRWDSLGRPVLTADLRRAIVEGVLAEAAGQSIASLLADRDARLVEIIRSLYPDPSSGAPKPW